MKTKTPSFAHALRNRWLRMILSLLVSGMAVVFAKQAKASGTMSFDPAMTVTNISAWPQFHQVYSALSGSATMSTALLSDRRYDLTYAFTAPDAVAEAGSEADDPTTATVETLDLSGTSNLVVGLKDPGAPDTVLMMIIDANTNVDSVNLWDVTGTEHFYNVPMTAFTNSAVDHAHIAKVSFAVYSSYAANWNSVLSVRLATQFFFQSISPQTFDPSLHTRLTSSPALRVGAESAGATVPYLFRISSTNFDFSANMPGYDNFAASVQLDRGTLRPDISLTAFVTNQILKVQYDAKAGDYYDLLTNSDLRVPQKNWPVAYGNRDGGYLYTYSFPLVNNPSHFYMVATKLRATQNLTNGFTFGAQGPYSMGLFVRLTDMNGARALSWMPLSTNAANFTIPLSDPNIMPLGFDPSKVAKFEFSPDPDIYTSGLITIYGQGFGSVSDKLSLISTNARQ